MRQPVEILVVHHADSHWHDLVNELQAVQLSVSTTSSLVEAADRIAKRPPDVLLVDGHFEHGLDLLLQARSTASGLAVVTVRKLRGGEGFYDATLPGAYPRYIEPTSSCLLARTLQEHLTARPDDRSNTGLKDAT